jgi:hypothetical protein
LSFRGLPVRLRFHPESAGKHYSFWHLISEGSKEDERIPDLRRCERLRWIAWTIREADRSDAVRCWENQRSGNSHVVLWLHNEHFAVVLAARNDYYLLKTAYVLAPNRERDFYREWQACGGKN